MQVLNFRKASPQEAERYYGWFVSTVEERLRDFAVLFYSSGGTGELDFTAESLVALGRWLERNVEFRTLTDAEIERYRPSTPEWLQHTLELPIMTDLWENRSIEVATYLGETFIEAFPFLRWRLSAQGPRNANFGQPILAIPLGLELPPILIAGSVIAGIARSHDPAERLMSIYEYWRKVLVKGAPIRAGVNR